MTVLITGPAGCGKTTFMRNVIKGEKLGSRIWSFREMTRSGLSKLAMSEKSLGMTHLFIDEVPLENLEELIEDASQLTGIEVYIASEGGKKLEITTPSPLPERFKKYIP
jgi:tRNA uridine 5-carbamoylmethylation protein Kti12